MASPTSVKKDLPSSSNSGMIAVEGFSIVKPQLIDFARRISLKIATPPGSIFFF